ncbi:hypothetical protein BDV36DRAFT_291282 [Aspergillus pseudocaelatus]|uniref:Uncharacterized protein n=1 Tax=Aspergillus pseudocaelatus TaxID=1825620 RepID=A0ABQ6WZE1_9EURO|nr:hypothetical protein BDV36DRAFT_291282 [Aspergillus pseudocaelatus]
MPPSQPRTTNTRYPASKHHRQAGHPRHPHRETGRIRIQDADSQPATSIGERVQLPAPGTDDPARIESGLDRGNGHVTTSDSMWGPKADDYSYLLYVWFHPGLGMDMCWTICNPRARILEAELWFSMFRPDPMSREAGLRYRWF